MVERAKSRRQVVTYLLLVLAFSAVFYFLILRSGKLGGAGGLYVVGIMWCPALAAMATLKLNRRSLSELGWKWPQTKYMMMSWFIPLLYAAIAYAIVWSTGLGGFPNHDFMQKLVARMGLHTSPAISTVVYVLLAGSLGLVFGLATALGEEIGWRGFLVPELSKTTSFTATALISGIVWSCWHYPILIWGDYNSGTPWWFGLPCFTVMVIGLSFIFAWMRLKSGSLWTAAMLHASHNLYVQEIFTPLTRNTGKTAWFIDEFGAVLPLVVVVFAIYFWRRRGELNPGLTETNQSHEAVPSLGMTSHVAN
ncbi:MAG: type II CAAX endopeptidase family protein [Candidatus Korobacteraceae bacterium]